LPQEDGSDELYDAREGRWIWQGRLPQGRTISQELGQVLDKLLKDYVKDRYPSADEVLKDICNASQPIPVPQRRIIKQFTSWYLAWKIHNPKKYIS
jgi:hypothetical protein